MNKHAVIYVMLAIVLGMFGVHNFYAGHSSRGIGQVCLTVFGGILIIPLLCVFVWVLIDICTINYDGKGMLFK